jgi:hypothetical protein
MSVIMSDMRPKEKRVAPVSFTVRDMNRNTQAVLEACRVHGQVLIRSRSGENFKIEPVLAEPPATTPAPAFAERLRQHREKVRALGFIGPRAEDMERFHRIIAGEE